MTELCFQSVFVSVISRVTQLKELMLFKDMILGVNMSCEFCTRLVPYNLHQMNERPTYQGINLNLITPTPIYRKRC